MVSPAHLLSLKPSGHGLSVPDGEPPLSTAQGVSVPGSHRYLMTVLST